MTDYYLFCLNVSLYYTDLKCLKKDLHYLCIAMKLPHLFINLLALGLFSTQAIAQSITVNDSYEAQELVEDVLINSPCVNVSNFSISGWTFDNNNKSYGYFTNGNSNFPFQDGVIITTGRAVSAIGPNTSLLSEGPVTWGGDLDLQQAIGENNSINATILEFDFEPLTNKVSFEYVFSSEQYLLSASPNQCNFSDGFAFLLKEVNGQDPYTNLAVVPGTTIPVKITTVRGPGSICPPANPQFFDAFNGTNHPTNYNGQTKILKAEANVVPGTLYHMKLVVADQGNQLFDSAIFLGGGSFKVEVDLGIDRLIATENPLCPNETLMLDATQAGANHAYQWFKDNVAVNGATNATYSVSETGVYHVEVLLENTSCLIKGQITIEYGLPIEVSDASLVSCLDDNNIGVYDLNLAANALSNGNANSVLITFYNTFDEAVLGSNNITNSLNFSSEPTTIFVRITNNLGCFSIANLELLASNQSVAPISIMVCDQDGLMDGLTSINLSLLVSPVVMVGLPTNLTLSYYTSASNALNQLNPLPNTFTNTIPYTQTIFVRLDAGLSCYDITSVDIEITAFSGIDSVVQPIVFCQGESEFFMLAAPNGFANYLWENGETTQAITIDSEGSYDVVITNDMGCQTTLTYLVSFSSLPTIENVIVNSFSGTSNSIELSVSGLGNYTFSLDGLVYQTSPVFSGLISGWYTVFIKDDVCGFITQQVAVLDYPKFFTPNGDGNNDYWVISMLPPHAQVNIFDRYGKVVYGFRNNGIGWDGRFEGRNLPATDYWFVINFENGSVFKGHFALVR